MPLASRSQQRLISHVPLWLTIALMLVIGAATVSDIRTYKIPNAYPIGVLALFLVSIPFSGFDPMTFGLHIVSGIIGFMLGFVLFAFKLMGGGDVKLFAAIALWVPLSQLTAFTVAVTFSGGILAVVVLAALWIKRKRSGEDTGSLSRARIPYGVAIFAGSLVIAAVAHL